MDNDEDLTLIVYEIYAHYKGCAVSERTRYIAALTQGIAEEAYVRIHKVDRTCRKWAIFTEEATGISPIKINKGLVKKIYSEEETSNLVVLVFGNVDNIKKNLP